MADKRVVLLDEEAFTRAVEFVLIAGSRVRDENKLRLMHHMDYQKTMNGIRDLIASSFNEEVTIPIPKELLGAA